MFGIPNVGTNLAGYFVTSDQELYIRYFQLAAFSPTAFYNDDQTTLKYHPFNLKLGNIDAITSLLKIRMATFNYMRTELYKISKYGGTLVRPMIADFPTDPNLDPSDVSTVMFGCCIKVEMQVKPSTVYKEAYFPTNGV